MPHKIFCHPFAIEHALACSLRGPSYRIIQPSARKVRESTPDAVPSKHVLHLEDTLKQLVDDFKLYTHIPVPKERYNHVGRLKKECIKAIQNAIKAGVSFSQIRESLKTTNTNQIIDYRRKYWTFITDTRDIVENLLSTEARAINNIPRLI